MRKIIVRAGVIVAASCTALSFLFAVPVCNGQEGDRVQRFFQERVENTFRAFTDPTAAGRFREIWFQLAQYSGRSYPVFITDVSSIGRALPNGTVIIDYAVFGHRDQEVTAFWMAHEYAHQVLGHVTPHLVRSGTQVFPVYSSGRGTESEDAADRWAAEFLVQHSYDTEPVVAMLDMLPDMPGDYQHSKSDVRAANVRNATDEPDPGHDIRMSMWDRFQGSLATFGLYVDGEAQGLLSNVPGSVNLSTTIDGISAGKHTFELQNIIIYRAMGMSLQVVTQGHSCSGTFTVSTGGSYLISLSVTPMGTQCNVAQQR
ncbi:MAG: hypothetical protein J0I17_00090 ['Candidatus Kapabacteria' thiocyanatum]|uniref:Peptidase M48 domain-containing protein n=1 Tax=Candidatus Kapaibacterium thiocyanatum TaxID=1895771 RepID=A0A1M3KVZ7_9BACT|nr:hypothetical protein ['Candidatus Kapabacteria' thiocyanatum]OJX56606.1 MAG: hypothetical protein BGO89_08610 ['Candidatus Kapabacteria' thiocyanatum]